MIMDSKYGNNIIDFLRYLEKFVISLAKDNQTKQFSTFKIQSLLNPSSESYFENLSKFLITVISAKTGSNFISAENLENVRKILIHFLGDQLENLSTLSYEELYDAIVDEVGRNGTITKIIHATKVAIDFLSTFKKVSEIIENSPESNKLKECLSAPVGQLANSVSGVFNLVDYSDIERFFNNLSSENNQSPDLNISNIILDFKSLLEMLDSNHDNNNNSNNESTTTTTNNTNTTTTITTPYYSKDKIIKVSGPSYVYTPNDCEVLIQVGIPPDTLKRDQSIFHFIVPHFLISQDVSISEVEFPIFYNKFVQKGKTKVVIICTVEQKQRIETILSESIFGPKPEHIYTKEEICIVDYEIDLAVERLAIDSKANDEKLDSYVIFKTFDEKGNVELELPSKSDPINKMINVKIRNTKGLISFQDEENGSTSIIDSTIESPYVPVFKLGTDHEQIKKFKAPILGVTFLGVSHGLDFTHCSHTTGFIIWINGSGIVVDPPVGNTTYLQNNGIYGKAVEHIILTHCHADHDSGILQKIIERNKVTLYTTKTINESYMRKLKSLTGISEASLKNYYTWVPVTIGNKIKILGAEFEFDYSFHVIPTIRFKLEIYKKKISYSADTFYDLSRFERLEHQGILSKKRIERLKSFVFDADMIIHESGVAPIHTPIENLLALPDEIKKKIRVVHCSSKINTRGEIIRPKEGLENTEIIEVDRKYKGAAECIQIQTALNHCNIFSKLTPSEVQRVFFLCKKDWVNRGDIIIEKGTKSDHFFIILSGKVLVYENEPDHSTTIKLCAGETLGESALQLDKEIDASATVIAETDVCLLIWKKCDLRTEFFSDLNQFITKVHMDLSHINSCRDSIIRAFQFNITQHINKEEVDLIANGSKDVSFSNQQVIFNEGDKSDCMYIVKQGRVKISSKKTQSIIKYLEKGEFFGETAYKLSNEIESKNLKETGLIADNINFPTRSFTATAAGQTILLKLDGDSIVNPRIQNIIQLQYRKNHEDNNRLSQVSSPRNYTSTSRKSSSASLNNVNFNNFNITNTNNTTTNINNINNNNNNNNDVQLVVIVPEKLNISNNQ